MIKNINMLPVPCDYGYSLAYDLPWKVSAVVNGICFAAEVCDNNAWVIPDTVVHDFFKMIAPKQSEIPCIEEVRTLMVEAGRIFTDCGDTFIRYDEDRQRFYAGHNLWIDRHILTRIDPEDLPPPITAEQATACFSGLEED